jgi:hypothetical protein
MKNTQKTIYTILFLTIGVIVFAQQNIDTVTYTENFRGQYHFSPKT